MKHNIYSFRGGDIPRIGRLIFAIAILFLVFAQFILTGAFTLIANTGIFYEWPLSYILIISAFPILETVLLQLRMADIAARGRLLEEQYILIPLGYFLLALGALLVNQTTRYGVCALGLFLDLACVSVLTFAALWGGYSVDSREK